MQYLNAIYALTALTSLVQADIKFLSPKEGSSISGTTIDIRWEDSGHAPLISQLDSYKIFLCAGGNEPNTISILAPITTDGDFSTGNSVSGTVKANVGGTTPNAYFLKMVSSSPGGIVINYSARFSLPDMVGDFPITVQTALKSVSGTMGPASQNQVALVERAPQAGFGVDYSLQSGPTRYAPMPKRPGTKITVKNEAPLYPTSAYVPYTTIAHPAAVQMTVTQPDTYVVSSMIPTFAAAAMPSDTDLQKFLNRWKD